METLIRSVAAGGIFLLMIAIEYRWPRRPLTVGRYRRWPINLGLAAVNMGLMRLSIGGLAYWSAVEAQQVGFGLLHALQISQGFAVAATLLLLDFAIYAQHILMHKWPVLWRLHQVHHTDLDFDASTAVRFHPLEIVLSMLYKVAWIMIIGADPEAVVAFEIILNGAATFNHSNIAIPPAADKWLRWLIVTPDMHRIHHSVRREETDSNYGFSISLWDRLCRTYVAQPRESQTLMSIGLAPFRDSQGLSFVRLIVLPFKTLRLG